MEVIGLFGYHFLRRLAAHGSGPDVQGFKPKHDPVLRAAPPSPPLREAPSTHRRSLVAPPCGSPTDRSKMSFTLPHR